MVMIVALTWYIPLNDASPSQTYDLAYEVARAIEFATSLARRPVRCARHQDIADAIASAFALDDLVLVGTLHMLSQIHVYTATIRNEPPD